MASKVQSMAEMARAEKEDFERVLRVNMQRQREEAEAHEAAETIRRRHQQDLLAQIHEAEEKRIKQRQEHLEEGRKVRNWRSGLCRATANMDGFLPERMLGSVAG